ncbi:MAG: hypothetical protein IKO17_05400 [Prevotella sp.]|nr:hypothetical protein [Prevotella sp.]MBR4566367.1 hypothetical protein [Prevotella sp.]
MKKIYIEPKIEPAAIDMLQAMLVSSVKTGDSVHEEYNEDDVTYSRESLWTSDDAEEE